MSACRSCKAEITWAETRQGRRIPLDVEERSDGNIVIEADGKAAYLTKGQAYTGPRFVSHFATCPQSKSWRRDE
jgi:hypothetical protein